MGDTEATSEFASASVRGLIESSGQYLLLKHEMSTGPIWGVPGGRAEIGEDPREAVAREVYEETRLEVDVGNPLEAFSYTWNGGDSGVVSVIFECERVGGTVDISANPDRNEPITGYRWLGPAAVARGSLPMEDALERVVLEHASE